MAPRLSTSKLCPGTAVYVQAILTGSTTSPNGNSDFTFFIDNVTSGAFHRAPNGDKPYQFNQTVFFQDGTLEFVTYPEDRFGTGRRNISCLARFDRLHVGSFYITLESKLLMLRSVKRSKKVPPARTAHPARIQHLLVEILGRVLHQIPVSSWVRWLEASS